MRRVLFAQVHVTCHLFTALFLILDCFDPTGNSCGYVILLSRHLFGHASHKLCVWKTRILCISYFWMMNYTIGAISILLKLQARFNKHLGKYIVNWMASNWMISKNKVISRLNANRLYTCMAESSLLSTDSVWSGPLEMTRYTSASELPP